jgi:hypothetical protein
MKPMQVSRTAAASDPDLLWNAYVKLCFWYDPDYTPAQQAASQAMLYDAELQNGGHFQYFENHGLAVAREAVLALDRLGARRQKETLEGAIRKHEQVNPKEKRVESVADFSEVALKGHYDEFDRAYSNLSPPLEEYLKAWLDSNLHEFIEWIP